MRIKKERITTATSDNKCNQKINLRQSLTSVIKITILMAI